VPKLAFRLCVASVKLATIRGRTAKEHTQKGKRTLWRMGITQETL